MQEFKVGDICDYSVGSDTYCVIVTHVNKSGKQVSVKPVTFIVKPEVKNAHLERLSGEDVTDVKVVKDWATAEVFKSRAGNPHHQGRSVLRKGFSHYRCPEY